MAWSWKTATPQERGQHIRDTVPHCWGNEDEIRRLFNLTQQGLIKIVWLEDCWRPEYEVESDPLGEAMDRMTENRCR